MNFTIPAKALTLLAPGKSTNNLDLSLKIGQQLNAKVLNISVEKNIIDLQLGNITTKVAADPPLTTQASLSQPLPQFTKGEQLKLLVNKLLPNPEFSLERTNFATQNQAKLAIPVKNQQTMQANSKPLVLKVLFTAPDLSGTTPKSSIDRFPAFEKGQQFTARIISIENGNLKLEFLSDAKKNNLATEKPIRSPYVSVPLEKIIPSQPSITKVDLPQLKSGQLISLEVTKTANHPSFKILDPQNPPVSVASEKKLTETIRQFLPIQQSPAVFIEQLGKDLPLLVANKTVPETLKQLAQQILHQLPKKTTLSNPLGLKQSIDNSGLFLENKLLQSEKDPSLKNHADFKAMTLKLIQALKQQTSTSMPAELKNSEHEPLNLKQLQNNAESSMAKMVLDQISSLPKEESAKQVWQLELPFLGDQKAIENITIQIEQDKSKQQQPEKDNWAVNITLKPPGLGELHCKISCINSTINTHFWSHSSETNHLVSQNLDFLKSRLEASGLKTGQIKAHDAPPESFKKAIDYPHKLIDEKI